MTNVRLEKCFVKTMERRTRDIQVLEKMRETKDDPQCVEMSSGSTSLEEPATTDASIDSSDEKESKAKKRRITVVEHEASDEMPERYRHIRLGPRTVRPEVYETIDKLKSSYHMSQSQAEAAVIETGNKLYARKWKYHTESTFLDLDTLPHKQSIRYAGKSIEYLALDNIVKEIMASDDKSTVTYCDDGSKKQGTGSFTVQGVIIVGNYRALPTMPIASESKSNLAQLKIVTLEILSEASGVDSKALFDKIDFVISDQTAHNLNAEEKVAEELGCETVPGHLFCNVHPSLMFSRVLTKHWAELENTIGRDKIYANFLVNATTNANSVTEQALDCITRLINHDFDHKQWNKAAEFDAHIYPKKNKSVSLKDERFNRLTLTCAVAIYHFDDVVSFLDKFQHVTNQLACIVRCFIELDILKVMFAVGALLGLHLVEPFLSLTTSTDTTYAKLVPAFRQLHYDLKHTDPERVLSTSFRAFQFVSQERFDQCKYAEDVCESIATVAEEYKTQVYSKTLLVFGLITFFYVSIQFQIGTL